MNEKLQVKVLRHKPSGLVVRTVDGQEAWIPNREISYKPEFNPRDLLAIRSGYPIGYSAEALIIGQAVTEEGGLAVASLAAAVEDPWEEEVPHWVNVGAAKIMVVTDDGIKEFYRGQIKPGVEARISRGDLKEALGERADEPFFIPRPGDRLAGIVKEANYENRYVELSTADFFWAPPHPELKANRALKITADQGFRLLTDSTAGSLLELAAENEGQSPENLGPSSVPPFKRILVLDDKKDVAGCLSSFLEVQGFKAITCTRVADARRQLGIEKDFLTGGINIVGDPLGLDEKPLGAALIDINLVDDPEGGDQAGIQFARELQQFFPSCRIILITGEDFDVTSIRKKAAAAGCLLVSGFILKPVDGTELLDCLNRARLNQPREGAEILLESLPSITQREGPKQVLTKAQQIRDTEVLYPEEIRTILENLRRELGADSVFLFSMHPETYEPGVPSQAGRPLANWSRFGNKLRYSPVRDVCLDSQIQGSGWYDNDVQKCLGKHRYLLYCYSDRKQNCPNCRGSTWRLACPIHHYRSCAAVPVSGGPGNPLGYSLFAIAMRESAFAVNSLLLYLQMAATQISVALRDWRQKNVDRANFSFLMSGLSACTLGHDLCNYLQHGIDIETAEGLLERYVSGPGTPEDLRKLKKVLRVAKEQLKLALGVAKSFRDLSRDREEAVEDVPLMGVLEGPYGARRAAHPEIVANKVTVHATRREMEVKDFLIRGRKNALVRVFQNLLNNSAQQIGQAGILPGAIRIDLGRQGQAKPEGSGTPLLCVDILDTGPGIHWANRKRIFEAKFTTRKNGSGMGLYLVEEELRRIGGSVEVAESIIGLGTKMRLWLPLVDRDNESPMQGT